MITRIETCLIVMLVVIGIPVCFGLLLAGAAIMFLRYKVIEPFRGDLNLFGVGK
jgi:hypothetical protein